MRIIPFFLLIGLACFSAEARSPMLSPVDTPVIRLSCPAAHTPYSLGIRTPHAFKTSLRYPLIVYLHGGIGANRDDKGSRAWDMFSFVADTIPVFLASPSADRASAWWTDAGLARIRQTVQYMKDHYPVDPERIILAGVSDGATGCFYAASAMPGLFAGFIPVSGFGGMLNQMGIALNIDSLRSRPFRIINAGRDALYPIAYTTQFAEALKQQGVRVSFTVYPDDIHGFDYRMHERDSMVSIIKHWKRPQPSSVPHK